MSKVTYEEAKKALNEMYVVLNDSNRWNKHKDLLNEVLNQHKQTTFDEVVKAWEKVNKDLNVYIHNNEFCVTDIDEEETSVFWYDIKTGGYEFECVSMEMIYAINLTIRYLQAKGKENE